MTIRILLPLILLGALASAQPAPSPLPRLEKNGAATQLIVDGKPFLMLAGELHNSTASSRALIDPVLARLAALHLNTVIGTASWELVEPEEGRFDFSLVDAQIDAARRHGLRLVLIWFASWKNANSSYAPLWVKRDDARFPMARTREGAILKETSLSPLGEASLAADAKAFRQLMRHLRETDPQHTVIMMQVENETGLLGESRDHSAAAEAACKRPVPGELLRYLGKNKAALLPELAKTWGAHGFRTSGTWAEIFGDDPAGDEIFMAWHLGRYVGQVSAAGKAELALPMYVNAWLGPQPGQNVPGQYPSGGPVGGVMDIWHAAAPAIDLLAPDIYVEDFPGVCAYYNRAGNPLFIPEAKPLIPNLFWALGRHAALGFSPFGIDDLKPGDPLGQAYDVLGGLAPVLLKEQAAGKVTAVLQGSEPDAAHSFAGHSMKVHFGPRGTTSSEPGFALMIFTTPDELLVAGARVTIRFDDSLPEAEREMIGTVDEGKFEKGEWIAGRRLNGDETAANSALQLDSNEVTLLRVKLYRRTGTARQYR